LDLVMAGATEHGLPKDYVATKIASVEAVEDLDLARDAKERAALNG